MYLRWIASLVNYILVAIFLWCNVSSLHCIFGVMYMHFWYAMHRQLCWCLVGVITIVQCIFGALFLGLGCNIFLCCVFGAMHCQLHRAGLLPQWHIFFIYCKYLWNLSFCKKILSWVMQWYFSQVPWYSIFYRGGGGAPVVVGVGVEAILTNVPSDVEPVATTFRLVENENGVCWCWRLYWTVVITWLVS